MNDTGSAIPTPGYDDLTPEAIAREYRGRIHQAEQHLARLEANDGDTAATTDARAWLDELRARAQAEGVQLD